MELDVRGTPIAQIRAYLHSLGGREQPDGSLTGQGWTATLAESQHVAFGTRVPRVIVTLSGDAAVVSVIYAALRLRAMRVGG